LYCDSKLAAPCLLNNFTLCVGKYIGLLFVDNLQRYRRRQVLLLDSVSELPEDVTRHDVLDEDSDDHDRQGLPSSLRYRLPDAVSSSRSYDGVVRLQDIRRFSYDSLLTRAVDELRGVTERSLIHRRRLASLSNIAAGGRSIDDVTDDQTHNCSPAHLRRHRGEVGQPVDVFDGRGCRVKRHLPRIAFTDHRRHLSTPRDNEFDLLLELSSARDEGRSITSDEDIRRTHDSLIDGTADIEDDRTSTTSSLSDVSTLQRVYGPRLSAARNTSRQTMSGKSIRSALSSTSERDVTSGHRSERCTRSSRGDVGADMTSRQSNATGSTKGVRFVLSDDESRRTLDPPRGGLNNEDESRDRRSAADHGLVLPKMRRKGRSRYGGEISRAFVYSYFTMLPNINTRPTVRED